MSNWFEDNNEFAPWEIKDIIKEARKSAMKKKSDCKALEDLLSLVMNPFPSCQFIYDEWNEEQIAQATKWALFEYLRASDNLSFPTSKIHNVTSEPVPMFIKYWMEDNMTIVCKREDITMEDCLIDPPSETSMKEAGVDVKSTAAGKEDSFPMPKVVAVDFDGVIHEFTGWKGKETIEFPIDVPAMNNELLRLREAGWKIIVWTARSDLNIVETFLQDYCIIYDTINDNPWAPENLRDARKIQADVYIDDRTICFGGEWRGMADSIVNFKPWWKKKDISTMEEESAVQFNATPTGKRPSINLSVCGYRADQIALFTPNSNATMVHYQNLGYTNWVVDQVTAVSRIPKAGGWRLDDDMVMKAFVVQLCFNYEILPVEFELISVAEGETVQIPSYLGDIHCGLSHIGFHVDSGTLQEAMEAFLKEGYPLLSLVSTYEHTGCDRLYDYAFMDTRPHFGFISKLIYRRK